MENFAAAVAAGSPEYGSNVQLPLSQDGLAYDKGLWVNGPARGTVNEVQSVYYCELHAFIMALYRTVVIYQCNCAYLTVLECNDVLGSDFKLCLTLMSSLHDTVRKVQPKTDCHVKQGRMVF